MLPGFRLLFATTVLAISILVFGLGAAALLRAAHEEFASLPAWRLAQHPVLTPFTPQAPKLETTPILAMLRIEVPSARPLPETLRRDMALPAPALEKPAVSQAPAEATQDSGSAARDAEPALGPVVPAALQDLALNAQASIDAPEKSAMPPEDEAKAPDVRTPDVKAPDSTAVEATAPDVKSAESKTLETKSAELKLSDIKPASKPVTEASEPLTSIASIERSSEATAFATEPATVVKKARRPSARVLAQRRQAARVRAQARAQAEQLRKQQTAFPLFGG